MEAPLLNATAYLQAPVTAVHPPDLDTDDTSLATEVLPAPPPLASVSGQRRDTHLKRPSQVYSYLPASDPGSTYSGLMGGLGLSLVPDDDTRLRKRPRVDKTAIINRAQRATARNLTPNVPPPTLSPPDALDDPILPDSSTSTNRDKGKVKEKPPPRVKEEPQVISLDVLEPSALHSNDDHCSACRSHGALVYCDGCPRAFHLWCLDPPLDAQDVPENRWYCPACIIRQNPPSKPRRSLFAPLLHLLQTSIPSEFELPEDIRAYFKDVATGPKGAYQDITETKVTRSSRFAIQEEREPFRLKDKNGAPVLCFRCGKSALPDVDNSSGPSTSSNTRETRGSARRSLRAPQGEVLWKSIVSCDHCALHWHLDCLDPPLSSMPPAHKKWMCPTHVDHIAPKRRVPRQVPPVTDVTERNRPNNGNIEIIPADSGTDRAKKMVVDEVHINGRRYRVPERVIVLDFWDKLGRGNKPLLTHGLLSGLSSPLTSLSSLDDVEPLISPPKPSQPDSTSVSPDTSATTEPDAETMRAVELLFGCRTAFIRNRPDRVDPASVFRETSDMGVQTDPEGCVKLDVSDAKTLSGLISATLHDLDRPESPSVQNSILQGTAETSRTTRTRKLSRSANSSRKSSRLPVDTGSARVTRSQAAPAATPASASPPLQRARTKSSLAPASSVDELEAPPGGPFRPLRSKSLTTLAERKDHKRSPAATFRSSSKASKSSSIDTTKHPESPVPTKSLRSEPSGSIAAPPPSPSTTRSPFKIRIPSAINAAVAAATAAAAAASGSGSTSSAPAQPTERSRSSLKEVDFPSSDEDMALSGDYVETLGITLYNGRRRAALRTSTSFQQPPNGSPTTPARVTRSATSRTPTSRPSREMAIFDRSPQYTDITSDSSSDFVPPRPTPKRISGRGRRLVPLPSRGLG